MLDRIIAHKRRELQEQKGRAPLQELEKRVPEAPPAGFRAALEDSGVRIIAEIKYASPSRGDFPCRKPPAELARAYAKAGAAAVSVLTDGRFFKGSPDHLQAVRQELPEMPLLRKDFVLEPYQVLEAAAWGASAYLLIAAALKDGELAPLLSVGADYRVEPLVEVHDLWELERAVELGCRTIGVNNRNLKTFEINLNTSFELARRLEGETGYLLVSESGITERSQILELRGAGYSAFLIGSHFMESADPGKRLAELTGGLSD